MGENQPSERAEGSAATASKPLTVTMVSTPGDGSCGIGTYAADLAGAFDGVRTTRVDIEQDERTARQFLRLALRALIPSADVVHVQHEYGLFRRDGSRYPGVMGLVFFPALFVLNLLWRRSVVVTLHSVLRPAPEEAPLAVRVYLTAMHRLIAAGSDHIVFLSEGCERRFQADVDLADDEFSVLPHGVNASKTTRIPRPVAKAQFGFEPEETVVMIPGFVRPPKGHDVFIEVARALPEYEFFVAGGGRPKGDDAAFATEIADSAPDNVTISGVLGNEEFPVALNAADVALLPYRVVTQSGTLNWCAAQELPVVSSDVPYFERLRRRWGNVETVGLDDVGAVVERVRTVAESETLKATLRENMRRYREANSFERVAEQQYAIYEVARGHHRGERAVPLPRVPAAPRSDSGSDTTE